MENKCKRKPQVIFHISKRRVFPFDELQGTKKIEVKFLG